MASNVTKAVGEEIKDIAEDIVENTGKNVAENIGNVIVNTAKDASDDFFSMPYTIKNTTKNVIEDTGKNIIENTGKDIAESVVKDVAENITNGDDNTAENILKGVEEIVSDNKNIPQEPVVSATNSETIRNDLYDSLSSSLNAHMSPANTPSVHKGLGKEGESVLNEVLDEAGNNSKLFLDNGPVGANEYKRAIDSISEKNSIGEGKIYSSHQDKLIENLKSKKHKIKNAPIETIGSEETMNSALDLMQDEIDNQSFFVNRKNTNKVSKAVDEVENKGQVLVREAEKQVDDARLVARREGFANMTARDFKRESKKSPVGYLRNLRYQEGVSAKTIAGTDKAADNKLIKEIAKNKKIDPLKVDKNMIDDYNQNRIAKTSEKDMNFFNYMGYYKVPQIATGIGGTAWLVNNLASRRGKQTNAELYGQQPMR